MLVLGCQEIITGADAQFGQRICVQELNIHPSEVVEVTFSDDEMFMDHSIVVNIDENGNFVSADIE